MLHQMSELKNVSKIVIDHNGNVEITPKPAGWKNGYSEIYKENKIDIYASKGATTQGLKRGREENDVDVLNSPPSKKILSLKQAEKACGIKADIITKTKELSILSINDVFLIYREATKMYGPRLTNTVYADIPRPEHGRPCQSISIALRQEGHFNTFDMKRMSFHVNIHANIEKLAAIDYEIASLSVHEIGGYYYKEHFLRIMKHNMKHISSLGPEKIKDNMRRNGITEYKSEEDFKKLKGIYKSYGLNIR